MPLRLRFHARVDPLGGIDRIYASDARRIPN